jgi:hypothetical protein
MAPNLCHSGNVCGLSITESRFPIALNRHLPPYGRRNTGGFLMCLRDGFEAATWVGFSAAALLAVISPIIFLI